LAVAGLCGIVLGIDREIRWFAAGIRTHALVSLSSAVITISALMLYHEIRESGDGARIHCGLSKGSLKLSDLLGLAPSSLREAVSRT
jgi:uncharacterized membrane protein YhiD involved in acid resistance